MHPPTDIYIIMTVMHHSMFTWTFLGDTIFELRCKQYSWENEVFATALWTECKASMYLGYVDDDLKKKR